MVSALGWLRGPQNFPPDVVVVLGRARSPSHASEQRNHHPRRWQPPWQQRGKRDQEMIGNGCVVFELKQIASEYVAVGGHSAAFSCARAPRWQLLVLLYFLPYAGQTQFAARF